MSLRPGGFAYKVIRKRHQRELDLFLRIGKDSPNVMPLLDFSFQRNLIVLQLPFCGLDGYRLTSKKGLPTESEQRCLALGLFSGLEYLHDREILHLDPKPENIFFHRGHWLLADFGNSAVGQDDYGYVSYTAMYRAPKAACGIADKTTDIFAVALSIREMSLGTPLYKTDDDRVWYTYASLFYRADIPQFCRLLEDGSSTDMLTFLTDLPYKPASSSRTYANPFISEFSTTLTDMLLNYTMQGAELFMYYWLSKLR